MTAVLKQKMEELIRTNNRQDMKRLYQQANLTEFRHHKKELQYFIQYLPIALDELRVTFSRFSGDKRLPPPLFDVHECILSYVHYDDDHFSLNHYGFWGYLDDAYLTGLLVQKVDSLLLNHTQAERLRLSMWLDVTRRTIPQQTALLDELFIGLLTKQYDRFHQVFA